MHTGRPLAVALCVALSFALAACGGGGGGNAISSPLPEAARVRTLTGSQPPVETAADQSARAAGIIARTDSLIASTFFGETSYPDLPTYELRTDCSRTRCTWREPTTGASTSRSLDDLGGSGETRRRTILTKNGITTQESRDADGEGYGAWMQHASFWVGSAQTTEEGHRVAGWAGFSVGDSTGSRPAVSATWRGLMVGTPSRGAARGNTLQGDAALTYTPAGNSLDAAFTDIKDLDRGAAHSTESVRFEDVPVAADGT